MSNATMNPTEDFRLQACQHPRLREALAFRTPAAPTFVAATPSRPRPSAPKSGGVLRSATAALVLGVAWFVSLTVATADFSDYDTDPTTPQVIHLEASHSTPARPDIAS